MTEEEIIQETLQYYIVDQNSKGQNKETNKCEYYNEDTKAMCAIGRCLSEPEYFKKFTSGIKTIERSLYSENIELDSIFKNQYLGKSIDFWVNLQYMHDNLIIQIDGVNEIIYPSTILKGSEDFWNTVKKVAEELNIELIEE